MREAITAGLNMGSPLIKSSLPPAPSIPILAPEKSTQELIDRLAAFVAEVGHQFEQAIMEREQRNPLYAFLFDSNAPEHLYYRWKVDIGSERVVLGRERLFNHITESHWRARIESRQFCAWSPFKRLGFTE